MGSDAEPEPVKPKRSRLRTLIYSIIPLALLLMPCLFVGPTGRAFHAFRLRNFADHEAVRADCLPFFKTHPPSPSGQPVSVDDEDIPERLRDLGDRCVVTVTDEYVSVDLGSFWVDSYGFVIYRATDQTREDENELSPGVVWWDAG